MLAGTPRISGGSSGSSTGGTIGATVSGGTNNEVLYVNGSTKLAQSTLLTFDGTTFKTQNLDTTLYADTFAGTDIGAQVNAAYAALPSTGGIIMLPAGVFSFATAISFATNGKRASLRGAPGGATELQYTGTGAAITVNNSIPGGSFQHVSFEACYGFTLTGNNTSLVSPQVGISIGGSNGGAGVVVNQVNIQTFGQGYLTGSNTYHTMYMNSVARNCGSNIVVTSATNAGEEIQFFNVFCVDGASNTATNAFDIQGASSVIITGGSIDDAQLRIRASVLSVTLNGVHIENPAQSSYGAYTYIVADSSTNGALNINGGMFMNDATTNSPTQFIQTGVPTIMTGAAFYNNSGSTVTNAVTLSSANGTLTWNGVVNENSAYTNIVNSIGSVGSGFANETGTPITQISTLGQHKFPYNSTTVPAVFCGDGTDTSSWLLTAAGGRAMYGYTTADANSNEAMVFNAGGAKGIDFYVNGTNSTFLSGTLAMWLLSNGTLNLQNVIAEYNSVVTTGWGTPAIYGTGRATAQTAANASVATYTVGGADGSFYISANVNVTAFSVGTFNTTCTYTDETNASRTVTFNFSSITGTLGIAIAAAGAFEGIPLHIRCKASTAITIKTSGTFTSLTYNVEGSITQIA